MALDEIHVNFAGFHPSHFFKEYIKKVLEEIYDESPYGSTLKATFSRHGKAYKGVVSIRSYAGPFFALATGTELKEVTFKLMSQMRRRLRKWKDKRFRHESLKTFTVRDGI
jgi:hypothetical protein